MDIKARFQILMAAALAGGMLSACLFDTRAPDGGGRAGRGGAEVRIKVGAQGTLGKRVAAKAAAQAVRLVTALTAEGEASLHDTIPLEGSGDQTVMRTYSRLAARKTWTLAVHSLDGNGVTLHTGGETFSVDPGRTAQVSLSLAPMYSVLKAAFFPLVTGIRRLEIAVDGQVRKDTSVAADARVGDTVRMMFDYLGLGSRHIALNVYGEEAGTVMFTGDTTLEVTAGQRTSMRILLRGKGNAEMTVVLGASGEVDVLGEIETFGACGSPSPGGWSEEFSGSVLSPAWSIFQYAGPRHNGQTSPANHHEVAEGRFRYILDPMTTTAYTHGYEPWFDGTWYWYDPALEISRPLGGSRWTLETKVSWYVPRVVNAAGFSASVHFGPPDGGFDVGFQRYSNDDVGAGSDPNHNFFQAWAGEASWTQWATLETQITRWIRFHRNGGEMTVSWSSDSLAWSPVATGLIPARFQCAEQTFHISGNAWFSPSGSYADYDYVRFDDDEDAPGTGPAVNLALNPSRSGFPHANESDAGWGGGSDTWDILDGAWYYPEWANGLALNYGGARQITIAFDAPKLMDRMTVWHHPDCCGADHNIPGNVSVEYFDGSAWSPVEFTREYDLALEPPAGNHTSYPDTYRFQSPVTGSKIRWSYDGSGPNILGVAGGWHGWAYEVDVMGWHLPGGGE